MTTYTIFKQTGNFANEVFRSSNFYEVQDYLLDAFAESGYDDMELFMSYYTITETEADNGE